MKKKGLMGFLTIGLIVFSSLFNTEVMALTAEKILNEIDDVMNAPKDQTLKQKVVLIDKNGKENSWLPETSGTGRGG